MFGGVLFGFALVQFEVEEKLLSDVTPGGDWEGVRGVLIPFVYPFPMSPEEPVGEEDESTRVNHSI